jgi:hypothetical protein
VELYWLPLCAGDAIQYAAFAVESPRLISTDLTRTQLLLNLVLSFPTATWGRDELATGLVVAKRELSRQSFCEDEGTWWPSS